MAVQFSFIGMPAHAIFIYVSVYVNEAAERTVHNAHHL